MSGAIAPLWPFRALPARMTTPERGNPPMGLILIVAVIAAMLLLNALFVAAEFAAVSSSKPKVAAMEEDGKPQAAYLARTISDDRRMDRYIAGAQVGITVTSLVVGFYGQQALTPYLEPLVGGVLPGGIAAAAAIAPILLIGLTILQVIFGELFPKSIAVRAPEKTARLTARPMRWSLVVLGPFITILNGSAMAVMRWLGLDRPKERSDGHDNEELRQLIADSLRGGAIGRSSHEMLRHVLSFQDRILREVMEPRLRMQVLTAGSPAAPALRRVLETPYTRFPVLDGTDANTPTGFVHVRDLDELARERPDAAIDDVVRPVDLLPETLSLAEAWTRMQRRGDAIALVFNEYGVVSGLVTVEDLVEEIVGEVVDEFDEEEPRIRRADGRVVLRGDMAVDEVNHRFGLDLPGEGVDTLSGLAALSLGVEDAARGTGIDLGGVRFTVERMENGLPRLLSFVPRDKQAEAAE